MMKLEFKSYRDQLSILKNDKKIAFESPNDEQIFIDVLKRNNYINIINPYKIYFLTGKREGKHLYQTETNYKEYLKHFEYDLEVSHQLLKVVFEFERYFSTSVAYTLSKSISNNSNYFDRVSENSIKELKNQWIFNEGEIDNKYFTDEFQQNINLLKIQLSDKKLSEIKNACDITQFKIKVQKDYSILDISRNEWFYRFNFMSFDDILFLYKVMSYDDQEEIARTITNNNMPIEHFKNVVRRIKKLRNKLAHLENLTIIINKQLDTDSTKVIKTGNRVFKTIEVIYEYLNKPKPDFIVELKRLYEVRYEKYSLMEI